MLLFAHVGITLGTAALLVRVVPRAVSREQPGQDKRTATDGSGGAGAAWLSRLAHHLDLRFLLVGSMLPDIIDKPVGHFFFRETFSSGRIYGHTLLFTLALAVPGAYLYLRRKGSWLAALAAGSFMHLVLDAMWLDTRTLLWPLHGVEFSRMSLENWLGGMLEALLTEPLVVVPELAGLAVVVWFVWVVVRRRTLTAFIRYGRID